MKVTVKVINQDIHEIDVEPTTTIEDLQNTIAELSSISPPQQRIIFQGRIVSQGTLQDYNITDGCTIHVVSRLPLPESQPSPQPSSQASPESSPYSEHQAQPQRTSSQSSIPMGVFAIPVGEDGSIAPTDMNDMVRQVMGQFGSFFQSAFSLPPAPPSEQSDDTSERHDTSSSRQHSGDQPPNQPRVVRRVNLRIAPERTRIAPERRQSRNQQPQSTRQSTRQPHRQSSGDITTTSHHHPLSDAARALTEAANSLTNAAELITVSTQRREQRLQRREECRQRRSHQNVAPRKHQLLQCNSSPFDLPRLGYFFPSLSLYIRLRGAVPNNVARIASQPNFIDSQLTDLVQAIKNDLTEAGVYVDRPNPYFSPLLDYFLKAVYDTVTINDLLTLYFDPSETARVIRKANQRALAFLTTDTITNVSSTWQAARDELITFNNGVLFTERDLQSRMLNEFMTIIQVGMEMFEPELRNEMLYRIGENLARHPQNFNDLFLRSDELDSFEFGQELGNSIANVIVTAAKCVYKCLSSVSYPNPCVVTSTLIQHWALAFGSNTLMSDDSLYLLNNALFSPNGRATSSVLNRVSAIMAEVYKEAPPTSEVSDPNPNPNPNPNADPNPNPNTRDMILPQLIEFDTVNVPPVDVSLLEVPPNQECRSPRHATSHSWMDDLPQGLRDELPNEEGRGYELTSELYSQSRLS
ncbi:hypothetical protein P9112_006427 [Eukaryota sp. TZLM1-RC]